MEKGRTMKRYLVWLPLLIVLLWCGKNWWYFDSPSLSSWGNMSFFKMTTWQLNIPEREKLMKRDMLSQFGTQPPFPSLWRFNIKGTVSDSLRTAHYPNTPDRIIHVLDTTEFQANGRNMNHWLYLYISKDIKKDNSYVLNHYPKLFYFKAIPNAWRLCFNPSWSWFRNDSGSKSHRRASNLFVLQDLYRLYDSGVDWSMVAVYITAIGGGLWISLK